MCWREGTGHLGALSWMHELGDRLVVQDGGTQTRGLALAVPQAARQLGESLDVAVPVAGFF